MKKQRYDSAKVKARFDENGFLVDTPIVARIGAQTYYKADGTPRVEFRPASEVFKPESLATYQGKPITLGHVTVNSKNAKQVVVGSCSGSGVRADNGVEVPVTVYDSEAISKAKSKIAAELSVGYTSVDIEEPGWGCNETGEYILDKDKNDSDHIPASWVRFDAVQTEITVNHVAMVFRGRAGIAKLNLDSEQEFPYDELVPNKTDEDLEMKKIKIDGVEYEVPVQVAIALEKADAAVSGISVKVDAAVDAAVAVITAERDQLKVKVDSIPELINAALEKAKTDEAALVALVATAADFGVKADGLDAKAIKLAVIKEASGIDASAKDDAYIDASFDFAVNSDKMAQQRLAVNGKEKGDEKEKAKADADAIPNPQNRFRK